MADPWIDRALQMQRETECFPTVTILKAALWLEKKHAEATHYDTAVIISLHYLVLALRKQENGRTVLREHYISQALMWRREAIQLLAEAASTHA
ncbi:MAG TPA: hypothetical protein VHM64_08125 [Candidatus Binatia bacterium]|nr:hypothetical protein [Candidatus Binatia bacterium]